MSIVSTLIDKARQRAGIASDSALASQFGVHRQAVSKWRNGDAYPDEEHIAEMAVMAGDDPVQWLVAVKAVRADGKAGKAWASLARRLATVGMALAIGVGLASPSDAKAAQRAGFESTDYTLCEMASLARFAAIAGSFRRVRLAMAGPMARVLLPYSFPQQGRDCSMSEMDPHDRINLTGPWAGFGFQAGHMFTPEGHQLEPCDMVWWSLTCNIAREWRLMMEEARPRSKVPGCRASEPLARKDSSVINLRDVIAARRQRRLGMGDPGAGAEPSNVVHMRRGPRPSRRG